MIMKMIVNKIYNLRIKDLTYLKIVEQMKIIHYRNQLLVTKDK